MKKEWELEIGKKSSCAFFDFHGLDIRDFGSNAIYNFILFSSHLVQRKSRTACTLGALQIACCTLILRVETLVLVPRLCCASWGIS